jgi:hypothetical protein
MNLGTFQCTVVFFTVYTKSIFTFRTSATQTPVFVAKSPNFYIIYDGNFPYSDVGIVIWFWYLLIHWCSVQSIQSFFTFWTPATWTPVVVVRFSNFWNMMAASSIQMLVSWYDSGYLSMYCGVLYSLNKVHLHILNTCNTDTCAPCRII